MIDIHAHILPGVDDGARDIRESLHMAEMAVRSGVTTMVVTPHANQINRYENYMDDYMQDIFCTLQKEIYKAKIPLKLLSGMEIYANRYVVQHIKAGRLRPLGRGNVYLIEFPFGRQGAKIEMQLVEMLENGYTPMIAHPERYRCVQEDLRLLNRWRQLGCYIQMNKDSVWDFFGERSGETARRMVRHNLVDVVASDAHDTRNRTTDMTSILSYLIEQKGVTIAKRWLQDNPQKVISGERE